jgi:hypothetical protein
LLWLSLRTAPIRVNATEIEWPTEGNANHLGGFSDSAGSGSHLRFQCSARSNCSKSPHDFGRIGCRIGLATLVESNELPRMRP